MSEAEEKDGPDVRRQREEARLRALGDPAALYRQGVGGYHEARLRALVDAASLPSEEGYAWTEVGPESVKAGDGLTSTRLAVGGVVQDILVDGDQVWAASTEGGVWKATLPKPVGAVPWVPLTDALPSLSTTTVEAATVGSGLGARRVLLVGTGSPALAGNGDNSGWIGMFRSVDDGLTWAALDGGPGATIFRNVDINAVAVLDATSWFVATRSGLFYTTSSGERFGANHPVYDDGKPVDAVNTQSVGVWPMTGKSDVRALVTYGVRGEGLRRFEVSKTGALARQRIGEAMWERRARRRREGKETLEPVNVAFDQVDLHGYETLAMSVTAPRSESKPPKNLHNGLEIAIGAQSGLGAWTDLMPTLGTMEVGQPDYTHVVALDPEWWTGRGTAIVYFGTTYLNEGRVALREPDGPLPERLSDAGGGQLHADQHVLRPVTSRLGLPYKYHDTTPMLSGNDGGIAYTENLGGHWTSVGSARTTLWCDVSIRRLSNDSLVVLGGLQDNGTAAGTAIAKSPPEDPTGPSSWDLWESPCGGDGGVTRLLDASTTGRWQLVAFVCATDDLQRKVFDGDSWQPSGSELIPVVAESRDVCFHATLAVAVDAAEVPVVVYAAHYCDKTHFQLYRCADPLGEPKPTFAALEDARWDVNVTALAAGAPYVNGPTAPHGFLGLWVGFADGRLRYSADARTAAIPTWRDLTPPDCTRAIGAIAVDPLDPEIVVVVTRGYAGRPSAYPAGRVYLRTEGSWRDISGRSGSYGTNIPDAPAYAVTICATKPRRIIVCTEVGVFTTTDDGAHWKSLDLVYRANQPFGRLPRVPVCGIASTSPTHTADVAPRIPHQVIGTYGRGAWSLVDLTRLRAPGPPRSIPAVRVSAQGAFGFVAIGQTSTRTVVLESLGGEGNDLAAVSKTGDGCFTHTATAPLALGVGERRTFEIRCAPTVPGIFVGEITLTFADSSTVSVPVSVEAVASGRPRLAVTPPSRINFGEFPRSTRRETWLDLTNGGSAPLTITGFDVDGHVAGGARLTVEDPPTGPIAPGATHRCKVALTLSGVPWPSTSLTLLIRVQGEPEPRKILVEGGGKMPIWVPILIGVGIGAGIGAIIYLSVKRREGTPVKA